MFMSFDGIDGAGKSTQISLFRQWLEKLGFSTHLCRDPGTTALGENIRALLLDSSDVEIDVRAEMLLYMASRAQLVAEVIEPALARGEWIISDRYLLANVAYQGYGGGLGADTLWQVGASAVAGCYPSLTFVLDVDFETAQSRLSGTPDRIERRGRAYFDQVRQGFLREAESGPQPSRIIDARPDPNEVQRAIQTQALAFFEAEGISVPRVPSDSPRS